MSFKIPDYGQRKVSQSPLPDARKRVSDTPSSLGAGVGASLAQVGSAAHRQALQYQADELLHIDIATVQEAEEKADRAVLQMQSDFQNVRGREAMGRYDGFRLDFDSA